MGLIGLKGTNGKDRNVRFFHNVTQAIRFLKEDKATTAGETNGAINLWIDDNGKYRCSLHKFLQTIDEKIVTSLFEIRNIIKQWLIEIK